jgi:hypothetical protein
VFAFVRARIDRQPRRMGQWLLTGSQEAPLMRGATESMAGRAAVLQPLPLSWRETQKVGQLRGGYPEVLARPAAARLWFSSYMQIYLERDVRDLALFRRFLCIGLAGSILCLKGPPMRRLFASRLAVATGGVVLLMSAVFAWLRVAG